MMDSKGFGQWAGVAARRGLQDDAAVSGVGCADRDAIGEWLFKRDARLFGVTPYDLMDMFLGAAAMLKAVHGHSEGNDRAPPTPGPDTAGFVRRSRMFAGNVVGRRGAGPDADVVGDAEGHSGGHGPGCGEE